MSFNPKYWYISKELGEGAKVEDILKVMETIGGIAMKKKLKINFLVLLDLTKRKKKNLKNPRPLEGLFFYKYEYTSIKGK